MPIAAVCPACGLPFELPDDAAGRSFACLRCRAGLATQAGGRLVMFQPPAPRANPFGETAQTGYYGPGSFQPGGFVPIPMTREQALAKVRGPGITLMMYGFLWGLAGLLLPLLLLAEEFNQDEFGQLMIAVGTAVSIMIGAFTIFCGLRMMSLRSYTLNVVCVVLTVGLGVMICPLFAVAAIWPLTVLLDSQVKPHFRAATARTESPH